MLILARNVGETIVIGDDVKVVVMDVKGSQIKLGIDAPKDVTVNREEIHNKILAEERARQQIEET